MNDRYICPHCGSENAPDANAWIQEMESGGSVLPVCAECGKPRHGEALPISRTGETTGRFSVLKFLLIAGSLTAAVVYLNVHFGGIASEGAPGRMVYELLLILVISSSLASGRFFGKIKYLAIWGLIFMVFMVGYSFRHELGAVKAKVLVELMPSKGYEARPDAISFPAASDGHFHIQAEVNGVAVMFLADTGASSIVLAPDDARKLGVDLNRLEFDRFFETANGMVRGSSIRIAELRIGGLQLNDVGASINEAPMSESLLGMTFFKRLKSYAVKDDVLTLYY